MDHASMINGDSFSPLPNPHNGHSTRVVVEQKKNEDQQGDKPYGGGMTMTAALIIPNDEVLANNHQDVIVPEPDDDDPFDPSLVAQTICGVPDCRPTTTMTMSSSPRRRRRTVQEHEPPPAAAATIENTKGLPGMIIHEIEPVKGSAEPNGIHVSAITKIGAPTMRRRQSLCLAFLACAVSFSLGCLLAAFGLAQPLSTERNVGTMLQDDWKTVGSKALDSHRRLLNDVAMAGAEQQQQGRYSSQQEDENLKWKLLEPPLLDEVQAILEARDKWWKQKLLEEEHKLKEEHRKKQIGTLQLQDNPRQVRSTTSNVPFDTSAFLSPYKGKFAKAMEPISSFITTKEQVLQLQQRHQTTQPIIYFITPTARKRTQMADLTRLGQTLLLDQYQQLQQPNGGLIYWVLIEDALRCTKRLRHFLKRLGLPFAHVALKTPPNIQNKTLPPRGVEQRNHAMDLVQHRVGVAPGIVYFGDDDNVYDVRLFNELRKIKQGVGVLPVGYRGGGHYERCIVNSTTGKVESIVEKIPTRRKYPVDMAGLAYHSSLLWANGDNKPARFSHDWSNGQQETRFLQQLIDSVQDLEPLAYNCTHFFVWHLQTTQPDWALKVVTDPEYSELRQMV